MRCELPSYRVPNLSNEQLSLDHPGKELSRVDPLPPFFKSWNSRMSWMHSCVSREGAVCGSPLWCYAAPGQLYGVTPPSALLIFVGQAYTWPGSDVCGTACSSIACPISRKCMLILTRALLPPHRTSASRNRFGNQIFVIRLRSSLKGI